MNFKEHINQLINKYEKPFVLFPQFKQTFVDDYY